MDVLAMLLVIAVVFGAAGLLPMKALRLKFGTLLAADAATLAQAADNNVMILFVNDVNVNEDLIAANLTEATFTGYAALLGELGTQQVGINPLTGEQTITILAPVGGWRYEATAAVDPVQTVYGYALMNEAKTSIWGAKRLDTPVPIAASGDYVDLGAVEIVMNLQPAS